MIIVEATKESDVTRNIADGVAYGIWLHDNLFVRGDAAFLPGEYSRHLRVYAPVDGWNDAVDMNGVKVDNITILSSALARALNRFDCAMPYAFRDQISEEPQNAEEFRKLAISLIHKNWRSTAVRLYVAFKYVSLNRANSVVARALTQFRQDLQPLMREPYLSDHEYHDEALGIDSAAQYRDFLRLVEMVNEVDFPKSSSAIVQSADSADVDPESAGVEHLVSVACRMLPESKRLYLHHMFARRALLDTGVDWLTEEARLSAIATMDDFVREVQEWIVVKAARRVSDFQFYAARTEVIERFEKVMCVISMLDTAQSAHSS